MPGPSWQISIVIKRKYALPIIWTDGIRLRWIFLRNKIDVPYFILFIVENPWKIYLREFYKYYKQSWVYLLFYFRILPFPTHSRRAFSHRARHSDRAAPHYFSFPWNWIKQIGAYVIFIINSWKKTPKLARFDFADACARSLWRPYSSNLPFILTYFSPYE